MKRQTEDSLFIWRGGTGPTCNQLFTTARDVDEKRCHAYPHKPDAAFDFDYYVQRHFPMVLDRLKPFRQERFEVERGLSDGAGGPPQFVAIGRLFVRDLAGFDRGMQAHGAEIRADIQNYTNIEPSLGVAETLC